VSGPAAELPTLSPDSLRHAGRRSLAPSASLVAAAGAPLCSWHVKPAAAYTKDVRPTKDNGVGNLSHPSLLSDGRSGQVGDLCDGARRLNVT
jgi:hypothetical protein